MQPTLSPGKANLSLVAYYGDKPPEIVALIKETQKILQDTLPAAFIKYDVRQVHATLVSLEGQRIGDAIINTNYKEFFNEQRTIDFGKAFKLLRHTEFLPLKVALGGYKEHYNYPFTSRGMHPYQRSFSIQGDIAVAMGWPYDGEYCHPVLERLRRSFNSANVLHKYHRTADDIDNDFYFVLGNVILRNASKETLRHAHEQMIEFFSYREPLAVTVAREHLRIIAYTDPKVPPDTTRCYSLGQAENNLDEIKSLYRNAEA